MTRWRGLLDLLHDGLAAGSGAIERTQRETAALAFRALEALPGIRGPARAVHEVHDATVSLAHAAVRVVGQAAIRGVDGILSATKALR